MFPRKWTDQVKVILGSGHFWLLLALMALCGILHYAEQLGITGTTTPSEHFGLSRHSMDRILFLIPIIYSEFIFGLRAGLVALVLFIVMISIPLVACVHGIRISKIRQDKMIGLSLFSALVPSVTLHNMVLVPYTQTYSAIVLYTLGGLALSYYGIMRRLTA